MMNIKRLIALFIIISLCTFGVHVSAAAQAVADTRNATVTISGTTLPQKLIGIVIVDSSTQKVSSDVILNGMYAIGETESNSKGEYSLTLSLPLDIENGDYKAVVSAEDAEIAEVTFTYNDDGYENTFFVDYSLGKDENDGSFNKPFKTVKKAQEAVRECKAEADGDIYVYLRGGVHFLAEPLALSDTDGGNDNIKVIYSAFEDEKPVISGGSVIDNWEIFDSDKNIYCASAKDIVDTRQLYVNGERAQRARSEDSLGVTTIGESGLRAPEYMAQWKNQGEIEFVFQPLIFTNSRCPVDYITLSDDGSYAHITMQEPGWTYMNDKGRLWGLDEVSDGTTDEGYDEKTEEDNSEIEHPWYIENAYELLDEPGEWYLDKSQGKFYYMPKENENMSTAYVVAARLEKLLDVAGNDLDNFIKNIEFRSVTFAESTWLRPNTDVGHVDAQNNFLRRGGESETYRDSLAPAAVNVARAKNVYFENCTFTRLGINGINMVDGVEKGVIRGCNFYDISGNAIAVGRSNVLNTDNNNPTDKRKLMKNILVNNNYINKIAVEYRSAAAISIGFPVDSEFSHNEIADIPYSGFHIGYDRSNTGENVLSGVKIINNYIHDCLNDRLYDGGAIYTVGKTGGSKENPNIIAGNYIKDQFNDSHVLYNDNTSRWWHHENNVIDLRKPSVVKWNNGREPTWAGCTIYGSYGGITYDNNYTTTVHNRVEGRNEELCSAKNTHVVPNADWQGEALEIINNAGRQKEYNKDFCKRCNIGEKILKKELWEIENGDTSIKTISLNDGGKAVYKESLSEDILHFNLKLEELASSAEILLENEDEKYYLSFKEGNAQLKDSAGAVLAYKEEPLVTVGAKLQVSLKVKVYDDYTKLGVMLSDEELLGYEIQNNPSALNVSFCAENGKISFGAVEEEVNKTEIFADYSFETSTSFSQSSQNVWHKNVDAVVESYDGDAHTGEKSAKVTMTGNFAGLFQNFALQRKKYYDISVWVKLLEFADEANDTGEYDYAQIILTRKLTDGTENYEYLAKNTPLVKGEWVQIRASYIEESLLSLFDGVNANMKLRIGTGKELCTYLIDDFSLTEVSPEALNLKAYGDLLSGEDLKVSYDYYNLYGIDSDNSYYKLYASNSADFENAELLCEGFLSHKEENILNIKDIWQGRHILLEVTPIDAMGNMGERVNTKILFPIELKSTISGDTTLLKAVATDIFKDGDTILAVYKDNKLMTIDSSGEGIEMKTDTMEDCYIKVFMWKSLNSLEPVFVNVEI